MSSSSGTARREMVGNDVQAVMLAQQAAEMATMDDAEATAKAIGSGTAAIAYALLEVASALRDLRKTIDTGIDEITTATLASG